MPKIAIVTDSCASIPESLIEALGIHWVPYYIQRGGEVLRDLVTARGDEFYRWLPTAKELPTTACPGPGDYVQVYETLAREEGVEEIVSIHMTSKGSGAYQAAKVAQSMLAESVPELRLIGHRYPQRLYVPRLDGHRGRAFGPGGQVPSRGCWPG